MKVILISNSKPGAGQSTIIFNMAGYNLSKGKKVLLIDADPYYGISRFFDISGGTDKNNAIKNKNIVDVLSSSANPEEVVITIDLGEDKTIDLIPAEESLFSYANKLEIERNEEHTHFILKKWLKDNKDYLKRYDYIYIDANAYSTALLMNGIYASDDVYILMLPIESSYIGTSQIYNKWFQANKHTKNQNNMRGIIINSYDTTLKELSDSVIESLYDESETPENVNIFREFIHKSEHIFDTQITGRPIALSKDEEVRNSSGYKSFIRLMKEFEGKSFI